MRLAFVDTTLTTPPTGGCQTFLTHLALALRDRGHDVSVITEPGDDSRVADQIRGAGVRVLDDVWPATDIPEERARRLAEWVNRASLDAYVVSVSRDVGWLALPFLRPETRTAAVIHSDGPAFYDPLAHYEPFVDCAIGVSGEIHQKLASRCRIPPERTRQIPYGVDRFSRPQLRARVDEPCDPAGLQLAYVGRIAHSQKRVLDLPLLVSELTGRGVPFVLHMIGDGPDAPRLAEAFRETKGGEQVRWWGWLAPADVRARLGAPRRAGSRLRRGRPASGPPGGDGPWCRPRRHPDSEREQRDRPRRGERLPGRGRRHGRLRRAPGRDARRPRAPRPPSTRRVGDDRGLFDRAHGLGLRDRPRRAGAARAAARGSVPGHAVLPLAPSDLAAADQMAPRGRGRNGTTPAFRGREGLGPEPGRGRVAARRSATRTAAIA